MANLVAENEMFFNSFEPMMKNRFLMYIDGIPSYLVRRMQRPRFTQEPKALPHINIERYVKGKGRWAPINITLYEPIVPSGAQAAMEWIRLSHESVTGRDGYADFYKKDIVFNMLGPVGDKVSEWIGKGAFVTELNLGELDWNTDEPTEIELTIQCDLWILNY
jgi:hypothetical protein